jgi:hypothetical protein
VEQDGLFLEVIWVNREAEYFCEPDWTTQISLKLKENFPSPRIAHGTVPPRHRKLSSTLTQDLTKNPVVASAQASAWRTG